MVSDHLRSLGYEAGRAAANHPRVVVAVLVLLALVATQGTVAADLAGTSGHDTNAGP